MGDQIRMPRGKLTYFFLHFLSNAIFKNAELPALCDVVSSISYVRVRFLRARVTLGLNSPRMRIKRKKEHGVVVLEKYVCLLILFVVY